MADAHIDKIKAYLEMMYEHAEKRPQVFGPLFSAEVAVLAIEGLLKSISPDCQDERTYTRFLGENDFGMCTFSAKFERDHAVSPVYKHRPDRSECETSELYADQFARHWAQFQLWRKGQ